MPTEGRQVRITVFSDYLCPWCYVAAVRLYQVQEEFGEKVALSMKAYPLVPQDVPGRHISDHSRVGRLEAGQEAEGESVIFHPWPAERPLPRSSLPALEAAKCAELQGPKAFRAYDLALFHAFFTDCQDISDRAVLAALAESTGLEVGPFLRSLEQGGQRARVLAERQEYIQRYSSLAQGIPLQTFNDGPPLVGCLPLGLYRNAVRRHLYPQHPPQAPRGPAKPAGIVLASHPGGPR